MVIKLMKREFRDSARSFVPVIVCILVGSILFPIQLNYLDSGLLAGIISTVLAVMFFAIMILSIRASIYVLYTNLYNQSGYELFTLPVKPWQIIVSKILTLAIWSLAISLVSILGFVIMFVILTGDFSMVFEAVGELFGLIGRYGISAEFFAVMFNLLVQSLQFTVLLLLAGSIANSSYFTRRRGWWTFLFVFVISWVLGRLGLVLGMDMANFVEIFVSGEAMPNINVSMDVARVMIASIYQLIITGFLFMGTLWMWDNKLEIMN